MKKLYLLSVSAALMLPVFASTALAGQVGGSLKIDQQSGFSEANATVTGTQGRPCTGAFVTQKGTSVPIPTGTCYPEGRYYKITVKAKTSSLEETYTSNIEPGLSTEACQIHITFDKSGIQAPDIRTTHCTKM